MSPYSILSFLHIFSTADTGSSGNVAFGWDRSILGVIHFRWETGSGHGNLTYRALSQTRPRNRDHDLGQERVATFIQVWDRRGPSDFMISYSYYI